MKLFRAFIIFFFTILAASSLYGFEIHLSRVRDHQPSFASGAVLLDPDDWTRQELLQLVRVGCPPIAWLDISRIEEGRSFTATLDRKALLAEKTKKPQPNPVVRFYLQPWQSLLRERIREIAQKGFAGLFLVGADRHLTVSDNPVARREMIRLLGEMAKQFKNLNPQGLVIMHEGLDLLSAPDFSADIGGIAIEGVWIDRTGRHTRPWIRQPIMATLERERQRQRRIFTIDFPDSLHQRETIIKEAKAAGFDAGFSLFPLTIQRSTIP